MKNLSLFLFFAAFLTLTSCGKDDIDCNDVNQLNASITEETQNINAAINVFNADPSSSNCQDVIDATNDFIDVAKDLQGCADEQGVGQEFREQIEEAEEMLNDLEC